MNCEDVQMKRSRTQYTAEFKAEAVRLAQGSEASIRKVAAKLGVPAGTLTMWVREAEQPAGSSEPLSADERKELQRLRRENARLQQEREFLGKAAAFFAKQKK
jgi:transposase